MLQETASDEQKRRLQARLLASPEDRQAYLHHLNLHTALRRQFAFDGEEQPATQLGLSSDGALDTSPQGRTPRLARWSWAAVAVAAVVLIAALVVQWPNTERPIAKITGLSGSLQWTGDGGRVLDELSVGEYLL